MKTISKSELELLSDNISKMITVTSKVFYWFTDNLNFCFPLFLSLFSVCPKYIYFFDSAVSFQVIFLALVLCFLK